MRRLPVIVLPAMFLTILFTPVGSTPQECDSNYGFLTKVEARAQETDSWCWAAVLQMATACHGEQYSKKQCRLATDYLHPQGTLSLAKISNEVCRQDVQARGKVGQSVNCCAPEHINNCYCTTTGWPDFQGQGFNAKLVQRDKGLEWDEVKTQICRGHPIAVTFQYPESAHQNVATGYKIIRGNRKRIWLIDPIGPQSRWWSFPSRYTNVSIGDGEHGEHGTDLVDIHPIDSEETSCK